MLTGVVTCVHWPHLFVQGRPKLAGLLHFQCQFTYGITQLVMVVHCSVQLPLKVILLLQFADVLGVTFIDGDDCKPACMAH